MSLLRVLYFVSSRDQSGKRAVNISFVSACAVHANPMHVTYKSALEFTSGSSFESCCAVRFCTCNGGRIFWLIPRILPLFLFSKLVRMTWWKYGQILKAVRSNRLSDVSEMLVIFVGNAWNTFYMQRKTWKLAS